MAVRLVNCLVLAFLAGAAACGGLSANDSRGGQSGNTGGRFGRNRRRCVRFPWRALWGGRRRRGAHMSGEPVRASWK